jgi:nitrite reductase (NADH) large subunit
VVNDDLSCRNDGSIYALGECAQHRGRLYGLVAPLWEQARILADRLSGRNPDTSYAGSRVSTKLKVMGVELAVMGEKDPNQESDELVHYSEPGRGVYKKLIIRDGRLAGAILLGDGPAIPGVLQAFDRGEALPQNRSELLFPSTGGARPVPVADLPATAQVCNCNGVSKGKIVEAVRQGRRSLQEVCHATRAGTGCGSCKSGVQAILDQVVRQGAGDGYAGPGPEPAAAFRPAWD